MRYSLAIFDFDGTLADSFPFFLQAQHALAEKHGFAKVQAHEVEALRNKPVTDLIRDSGLPLWKLPRVAADFRRMMGDADGIAAFAGTGAMLAALQDAGVKLAVLTSNAPENVRRVLGDDEYARFANVDGGMSMLGKAARLRAMCRRLGATPAQSIYIGDQDSDGDAAHEAGLAFGAVAWGYGALAALRRCVPAHEFATPAEIVAAVAGQETD
jgi:phosphoglycolate phosphatase